MGSSLSTNINNNRLSFDYVEYLRERDELSSILRLIAKSLEDNRQKNESMQKVNMATSVTAGVAGAVALVAAPATFGLSMPIVATTVGVLGNSIAAASITSSAVSYSHGFMMNKDIVKKLENLQPMIESISRKDEQVHALIKSLDGNQEGNKVEDSVTEARTKFDKKISFSDEDKTKNAKDSSLTAWSILSPGTYWLLNGKKSFESEKEFEAALVDAADKIDEKTALLQKLDENKFKKLSLLPVKRHLSRCRLTYVDGGGGCARVMKVQYYDPIKQSQVEMESDSSNVLLLQEGATQIKVTFSVAGGRTIKQVDRSHPKQPWVKNEKRDHVVDVMELDEGDGVDAVFYAKGSFANSHIHKAWDFGRHPATPRREWEWWPELELEKDQKELLPDSEKRVLKKMKHYASTNGEPCGIISLSCGACFGRSDSVMDSVTGYKMEEAGRQIPTK